MIRSSTSWKSTTDRGIVPLKQGRLLTPNTIPRKRIFTDNILWACRPFKTIVEIMDKANLFSSSSSCIIIQILYEKVFWATWDWSTLRLYTSETVSSLPSVMMKWSQKVQDLFITLTLINNNLHRLRSWTQPPRKINHYKVGPLLTQTKKTTMPWLNQNISPKTSNQCLF